MQISANLEKDFQRRGQLPQRLTTKALQIQQYDTTEQQREMACS